MRNDYPREKARLLAASHLVTAQTHLLQLIKQDGQDARAGKAFDLVHEAVRVLGLLPDQS